MLDLLAALSGRWPPEATEVRLVPIHKRKREIRKCSELKRRSEDGCQKIKRVSNRKKERDRLESAVNR
jgi:hypothetical protein